MVAHDDAHSVDCLQIRSEERGPDVRPVEPSRRPSSLFRPASEPKDQLHGGEGGAELSATPENLPHEEQGNKAARAAKNSSPKARRGSTNTPSPPAGRSEKKQRSSKTISPNRDAEEKSTTAAQSCHAEQMSKYVAVEFSSAGLGWTGDG